MDASKVASVLLADGWHDVAPGTFHAADFALQQGIAVNMVGPGFVLTEVGAHGATLAGPLRSVLAVKVST